MNDMLDKIRQLRGLGYGLGFKRNSNQPGETVTLDTKLTVDLTIHEHDLGHPMARELAVDHLAKEMVDLLRHTADELEATIPDPIIDTGTIEAGLVGQGDS